MNDTIKNKRPPVERKQGGLSGRVEHDERGNALWVRTRATDLAELPLDPQLSIVDEGKAMVIEQASTRAPSSVKSQKKRR